MAIKEIVFLDTSAQWIRLIEEGPRAIQFRNDLATKRLLTSDTVYREFQHSWINPLQLMRDTVGQLPADADGLIRLRDFLRELSTGTGSFGRAASTMMLIMGDVIESFGDRTVKAERLYDFLDMTIRRYRDALFFNYGSYPDLHDMRAVGDFITRSNCGVARRDPDIRGTTQNAISCYGKYRRCDVSKVLMNEHASIQTALPKVRPLLETRVKNAWQRWRKHLTKIKNDRVPFNSALGEKTCFPLGDFVIISECPQNATLVSRDRAQCRLAELVGKRAWQL